MYLDEEFGDYFTLIDTSGLTDKGTIKIIRSASNPTDSQHEESFPDEYAGSDESQGEETENQGEDDHVETITDAN